MRLECDGVDTDCDGAIDEDYQVTECGFSIRASASASAKTALSNSRLEPQTAMTTNL